MSWDTDWANGVSETITEIQTIASNQATDETNIAALQAATQPIASSTSSSLPSVNSSTLDGRFCKILAYGVTGSSASSVSLLVNGSSVLGATVQSSQTILFEADFYWDASTGHLPIQPLSPIEDTNQRFHSGTVSGSPSTLTFSLSGFASVSNLVLKFI